MKAASKFKSAASAVALSAALVVPGALVAQFAVVPAAEAAVVRSIVVSGNQRIDADTIRNYVSIKPGKAFSSADIDDAVKALFGTGLFSDVQINQSGSSLVIKVSEYQVVNQVLFQGNKKIKDAQLAAAVQMKPRGVYSEAAAEADVEAVKAAYRRIGRDDATVTTQIMDLGDNRVNVVFNVNEGDRTKIASINFIGNHAYSSRRLADLINTKRSGILSFVMRDDIYDEQKLQADQELLRRFYFNHGYADFQVVSAGAELDPVTNQYTITITVDEGARYRFGDVSVDSSIPEVDAKSLESLVETRKGGVYSAKDVEDSIIALTERVAGSGYAFAEVTPRGDRNFEDHTISVVYTIDQGAKAYIERIEIRGNSRTRDYVIRREFDLSEGDAFNQVMVKRAKKRLEDLDYFQKVEISTAPGSEPDQVVLVVDVVEKSTGEFSIGAGYSTGGDTPGATLSASVTERNFLGRGQFIRLSAGGGRHSRDYAVSFTEPYFLGRRIAAGFDIFKSTREYKTYDSETTGGSVRFGLPITDNISAQLAYNLTQEEYKFSDDCWNGVIINPACDISPAIRDAILVPGSVPLRERDPWTKSSVSAGLTYNTIDDMKNPRNGIFANFNTEVAGVGGDAKFVKVTGRASYYQTLSEQWDLVGLVSAGAGHVESYGSNELRVFDHFQNSDRMIRGFEYNGIGPYAFRNGVNGAKGYDHLGGSTYFNASAEAQFPMPVVPESIGLRAAVFADAATLYGNSVSGVEAASTDMKWRASVGVGLLWASPFGPLRIDYAVPVKKYEGDDVQELNFGMSTRF